MTEISVTVRGRVKGSLDIYLGEAGALAGSIAIVPSVDWQTYRTKVDIPQGVQELCFVYRGKGKLDVLECDLE